MPGRHCNHRGGHILPGLCILQTSFPGIPMELLRSFLSMFTVIFLVDLREFRCRVLNINETVSLVSLFKSHRVCVPPYCRSNPRYLLSIRQSVLAPSFCTQPLLLADSLSGWSLDCGKLHPHARLHLLFSWLPGSLLLSVCILMFI